MKKHKGLTRRELLSSTVKTAGGMILPASVSTSAFADEGGEQTTDLLIIGAGPFGLAVAAQAQSLGIDHIVVGKPMGFWKDNMPPEMLLRSSCEWSLDPTGAYSIHGFLESQGKQCSDVEPLSRNFYLDYVRWFQRGKGIESQDLRITAIGREGGDLLASASNGSRVRARNVVVAVGFENFAHVPGELAAMFPGDRMQHTCHLVDFAPLEGRKVVIIGGRQSAFEWAAMIREAGADSVDLVYRHDTPLFETSEWGWVGDIVDEMPADPGWFRRLSAEEKAQLNRRFWEQGRLRLEPWLYPRIDQENIRLHPNSNVIGAKVDSQRLNVELDSGTHLAADNIVFATGYRVDMRRVPFLNDPMLAALEVEEGYAPLDVGFQSRVPGLYFTSLAATRDFGSFLAFTVSARAQASVIGAAVQSRL